MMILQSNTIKSSSESIPLLIFTRSEMDQLKPMPSSQSAFLAGDKLIQVLFVLCLFAFQRLLSGFHIQAKIYFCGLVDQRLRPQSNMLGVFYLWQSLPNADDLRSQASISQLDHSAFISVIQTALQERDSHEDEIIFVRFAAGRKSDNGQQSSSITEDKYMRQPQQILHQQLRTGIFVFSRITHDSYQT